MEHLALLQLGGAISWGLFVFALGACVGSLTNVLVYRLPLGLNVTTAPSRCPACGTRLTWRENIPVLGWIVLRGKCRFCKSRISPEYPMVEAFVGLLFVSVFVLWYLVPEHASWLGVDWGQVRPEWAMSDWYEGWPRTTWAPMVVVLVLLGSLCAMTLVDAKTATIPLHLPWFATIVGVGFHTIGAMVQGPLRSSAPGTGWAIPTPGGSMPHSTLGWWWTGASLAGTLGIGVSLVCVRFGWIRRSFADYEAWERATFGESPTAPVEEPGAGTERLGSPAMPQVESWDSAGPVGDEAGEGVGAWRALRYIVLLLACVIVSTLIGWGLSRVNARVPAWAGLVVGGLLGPFVAAFGVRGREGRTEPAAAAEAGASELPTAPEMWIQYPHARREMFKELIFLTPIIAMALGGGWLAARFGAEHVPWFWLVVLCGTLMGYLLGGAIVWAVRIGGSLAFGKEAMGLGDVHLMAAVGACLGWVDPLLAFPLAAVVGLYCIGVSAIVTRSVNRTMPFGPYLAGATVIVLLGKPLVELGINQLLGVQAGETGINLP